MEVRDLTSGKPVPGVEVLLLDEMRWDLMRWNEVYLQYRREGEAYDDRTAERLKSETFGTIMTSDERGRVRLPLLHVKGDRIAAKIQCWHGQKKGSICLHSPADEHAEGAPHLHTLWLRGQIRLRVRVLYEDRTPAKNARLRLRFAPGILGRAHVYANEEGLARFSIGELTPEKHGIRPWLLTAEIGAGVQVERAVHPDRIDGEELTLVVPGSAEVHYECMAARGSELKDEARWLVRSLEPSSSFCDSIQGTGAQMRLPLGQRFRIEGRYADGRRMSPVEFTTPERRDEVLRIRLYPEVGGERILRFRLMDEASEHPIVGSKPIVAWLLDASGTPLDWAGDVKRLDDSTVVVLVPPKLLPRANSVLLVWNPHEGAEPLWACSPDLRAIPSDPAHVCELGLRALPLLVTGRIEDGHRYPNLMVRAQRFVDSTAETSATEAIPGLAIRQVTGRGFRVYGVVEPDDALELRIFPGRVAFPQRCKVGDRDIVLEVLDSPGKRVGVCPLLLTFAKEELPTTFLRLRLCNGATALTGWQPAQDTFSHCFTTTHEGSYTVEFTATGSRKVLHAITGLKIPGTSFRDPRINGLSLSGLLTEHRVELRQDGEPYCGRVLVRLTHLAHPRTETLEMYGPVLRLFTAPGKHEARVLADGCQPIDVRRLRSTSLELGRAK